MEKFFDYIDSSLPDNPQDKNMYKYKRALLDEMESRAFELEKRGLTDENVVADLVIGEHPDLKEDYNRYLLDLNAKDKCRRFIISNIGYLKLLSEYKNRYEFIANYTFNIFNNNSYASPNCSESSL